MEIARFFFWTAMKALSLVFLGLLAAKGVGSLQMQRPQRKAKCLAVMRVVLYTVILALAALGARNLGYDVAAEVYSRASQSNLARGEVSKAYSNALRAVELRPGILRYWRTLAAAKFAQHQFASLVEDLPVFQALSGGKLEEEEIYRIAAAHYFLAQYDKVIPLTQQMIRESPVYGAPYVLQGYAYTAQKKFPEAERSFLAVLQMFPTQEAAVEGLAHVYFLTGDTARALGVLNETAKFPFPREARKRFEALKALYAQ